MSLNNNALRDEYNSLVTMKAQSESKLHGMVQLKEQMSAVEYHPVSDKMVTHEIGRGITNTQTVNTGYDQVGISCKSYGANQYVERRDDIESAISISSEKVKTAGAAQGRNFDLQYMKKVLGTREVRTESRFNGETEVITQEALPLDCRFALMKSGGASFGSFDANTDIAISQVWSDKLRDPGKCAVIGTVGMIHDMLKDTKFINFDYVKESLNSTMASFKSPRTGLTYIPVGSDVYNSLGAPTDAATLKFSVSDGHATTGSGTLLSALGTYDRVISVCLSEILGAMQSSASFSEVTRDYNKNYDTLLYNRKTFGFSRLLEESALEIFIDKSSASFIKAA